MPAIADFTAIPNMGVVLLSCITPSEITKASAIYSSFLIAVSPITTDSFDAEAASAEFLITMTAPPDNSATPVSGQYGVARTSLLGGLHHEYRLEKDVA